MELDRQTCFKKLERTAHGVLATLHAKRGVDAIPVVFAINGEAIVVPVDTVKQKRTTDLQRIRNLESDPRCVLLAEHYSDNWDELWWVRVHCRASILRTDIPQQVRKALADKHPQYVDPASVVAVILLTPEAITGWSA